MRISKEMSGLPPGNARQHDSVPNWLAGFFEDVAFSDGSGQARADAEGERVKTTERRRSSESVKDPMGLPADKVACLPAHKTQEDICDDAGSLRAFNPHSFRLLYGPLMMLRGRRQMLRLGVTGHAERLIGSIRRECPERVVIFSERITEIAKALGIGRASIYRALGPLI
jgi:hypothetical protein